MTPKRLKCSFVGCNNEHSSRHLLPTSEPLKTQCITFVFEGNGPHPSPIYLNVSMFTRIIRDPASPTEVVIISVFFFYEFLRITFLNNVLAMQRMRQGCQVLTAKPAQFLLKTSPKLVQSHFREVKYTFFWAVPLVKVAFHGLNIMLLGLL